MGTYTCVWQTRHNQSLNPKTHTKRSFQLKFRFHSLSPGNGDGGKVQKNGREKLGKNSEIISYTGRNGTANYSDCRQ